MPGEEGGCDCDLCRRRSLMSASISRYLKDFSAPRIDLSRVPPKYFPDLDDDEPDNSGH